MRKLTSKAIQAFNSAKNFKESNTTVEVTGNKTTLKLHNNIIAVKENNSLKITNAGWFSKTTKERLNALQGVNIVQRQGKWYLNGVEWDGKLIEIYS